MISLQPVEPAHAAALQPLLEHPEVTGPTPLPHPYPPDGAREFAARAVALRAAGTQYSYAICEDGQPIGVTLLKEVDRARGDAELGYWLGRPYWGGGRATAAAGATVAIAFGELGLVALRAICLADHAASLRVLAKLGFQETRRFVDHHPKWPEGRPHVELRVTRQP